MQPQFLKVRDLGSVGVIKDLGAYDLPLNGFNGGRNVRYTGKHITRSPVYRTAHDFTTDNLEFIVTAELPGVVDAIMLAADDGQLQKWIDGTVTDVTPVAWTLPIATTSYWTGFSAAGLVYLNNSAKEPVYLGPADTNFQVLPAWDANWRTLCLRPYKDFLIALNVTKSGTNYPNMVKWSDTMLYGAPPTSWDETDQTTNAGENTLTDLGAEILDGLSLRDSFAVYTKDGIYLMDFVGAPLLFAFRKLFDETGIINTNCVVEVDGIHYVFGPTDLYIFDGSSRKSIATGRIKSEVFARIDRSSLDKCFVVHDPYREEVRFCYRSVHSECKWTDGEEANEAAVFNYAYNTWSFIDLPNVTAACTGVSFQQLTYDEAGAASLVYSAGPGSYASMESESNLTVYMASKSDGTQLTTNRLAILDSLYRPTVNYLVDTEMETDWYLERTGMDFDEFSNLRDRLWISAIYPQCVSLNPGDGVLEFAFGASEFPNTAPTFSDYRSFNSYNQYKVDFRVNGRYLGWRARGSGDSDFMLSGMDIKVINISRR